MGKAILAAIWLLVGPFLGAGLAEVAPPRGWSDVTSGKVRVVSNGNATVTIGPWVSLGGRSVQDWLLGMERRDPSGGRVLVSNGVRSESVPGAASVTRRAAFDGQEGLSVLYACPGQQGEAKLLTLDVRNGAFFETLRGARFGEQVCKAQIAALDRSGPEKLRPKAGRDNIAGLNQTIPNDLRPVGAELYTRAVFKGFPAVRSLKLEMVLQFPDGTRLACADWSPNSEVSPKQLTPERKCRVRGKASPQRLHGFEPGETLEVSFGSIAGLSIDSAAGSAGALSGGDLKMTHDGQIALGRWSANTVTASGGSARAASGKREALVGRYYLEGHTITIVTAAGEVVHGFIAYSLNDEKLVRSVFLNGDRYWSRD